MKCTHSCSITWKGPKCFCPEGFIPDEENDPTSCIDMNECESTVVKITPPTSIFYETREYVSSLMWKKNWPFSEKVPWEYFSGFLGEKPKQIFREEEGGILTRKFY